MGAGAQVGILLPFSRQQESEADKIGLILMADAGYDPHEAVRFWERMNAGHRRQKRPAFLNTHPGHETGASMIWRNLPTPMPCRFISKARKLPITHYRWDNDRREFGSPTEAS